LRPPGRGIGRPLRTGPDGPGRRSGPLGLVGRALPRGRGRGLDGPLRLADGRGLRGPGRLSLGTGDPGRVAPALGLAPAVGRGDGAPAAAGGAGLIAVSGEALARVGPDGPVARRVAPDGRAGDGGPIALRRGAVPPSCPQRLALAGRSRPGRSQRTGGRQRLHLAPAACPVRQGPPGGDGLGLGVVHSRTDRGLLGLELDPADAVEIGGAEAAAADVGGLEMVAADHRHSPVVG